MNQISGSSGLAYTVEKGGLTCKIVGMGDCKDSEPVIPSVMDGYTVTGIAGEAFADCTHLTSVIIGEGISCIGAEAFRGCTALTKAVLPDSVREIGWGAFCGCTALRAVSLGNGLTEIGACAFMGVRIGFVLPACTERIGDQAFCGASEILVQKGNPFFADIDGNLCTGDGKTLLQYAIGKRENTFCIDRGVTAIGNFAFSGCTLSSVDIGNSVTEIGCNAFYNCAFLENVQIGIGIRKIGDAAFGACPRLIRLCYRGSRARRRTIRLSPQWACDQVIGIACTDGTVFPKRKRSKNPLKFH